MDKRKLRNIKNSIVRQIREWFLTTGGTIAVIGISGGKDSTCVAALCKEALGAEYVIGVSMPNGEQSDMDDVDKVFEILGIRRETININKAFTDFTSQIENVSEDAIINLPARLRMSALFMVAQTVGGRVMNTCNLSEDMIGYSTIYGDYAGLYAPLQNLTCSEVKELTELLIGDTALAYKVPSDGLCGQTDEEKLGFTYDDLDKFIRTGEGTPELRKAVMKKYKANKFKLDTIRIPGARINLPNYIINYMEELFI